jgi:hypothetical protein
MQPRLLLDSSRRYSLTVAVLVLLAAGLTAGPAFAQQAGRVNLTAAESRRVWLGPTYWRLRVCNDSSSKGTVTVTIDSRDSEVLAPGYCTENSGGSIDLRNDPAGPAAIIYRSTLQNFM